MVVAAAVVLVQIHLEIMMVALVHPVVVVLTMAMELVEQQLQQVKEMLVEQQQVLRLITQVVQAVALEQQELNQQAVLL
jgi:hypothetical protein